MLTPSNINIYPTSNVQYTPLITFSNNFDMTSSFDELRPYETNIQYYTDLCNRYSNENENTQHENTQHEIKPIPIIRNPLIVYVQEKKKKKKITKYKQQKISKKNNHKLLKQYNMKINQPR
jgi:hypothetical protein